MSSAPAGPVAVVLVGHGSQRTRSFEIGLRETGRRLQARYADGTPVRIGFFEFLEPTVEQAVDGLVEQGSRHIIIMPYFLFDGREVRVDLPHLLDGIRQRHPAATIVQAGSLGVADSLIDLIAERVAGALEGLCQYPLVAGQLPRRGAAGPLGIILVNRGSRRQYDDGSRLGELVEQTRDRLGVPVRAAQAEHGIQTIELAAGALHQAGARRIVVVPYLHHPGKVLFANIIPAIGRAGAEHPDVRFSLAWTLCVDDRLVDLCVQRIAAARAGAAG